MSVIEWAEPEGAKNAPRTGWSGTIISELKGRPNQWALIAEVELADRMKLSSRASNLRTVALRQSVRIQTAIRSADGTSRLYARTVEKE